ncbi:hypothetical protein ACV355_30970, partial [Pseudomonas aeruginosa]
TFFSSLEMSRMVLCGLGLSEEQADARIRRFRRHDEEVLASQHLFYNDRDALIKSAREAREGFSGVSAATAPRSSNWSVWNSVSSS